MKVYNKYNLSTIAGQRSWRLNVRCVHGRVIISHMAMRKFACEPKWAIPPTWFSNHGDIFPGERPCAVKMAKEHDGTTWVMEVVYGEHLK